MMQIQYQLDMLYIISANMQCQEKSIQIQGVMVCVCARSMECVYVFGVVVEGQK